MLEPAPEVRESPSVETHASRGVFYFPGRVRCPLAGVGTRGDFDGNRLVLDDSDTEVTIDRGAGRITVRNSRGYARKTVICDLLFLAEGQTASGSRKPFSIHLKILKSGRAISLDLHRHLRTQDPMVSVEFEPFEVIVTDGAKSRVVFDKDKGDRLCRRPSLALRVVKALMAMRNHLDGVTQDPREPGFRIADLSVGFGALGLEWMMARARLGSVSSANAALIERGSIVEMLRDGAWELELTSFADKWLPEVVQRDLFLFGLDELPLLQDVGTHGLKKGQTLAFRFEKGQGEVLFAGRSEPLPNTLDVARAYLEFHMLGGLLAEHADHVSRSLRTSRAPASP
jgi:hypothetical protein